MSHAWIVIFVTIVTIVSANEEKCKEGLKVAGIDCDKYAECIDGGFQEKDCPEGQHFNDILKDCDDPDRANCTIASDKALSPDRHEAEQVGRERRFYVKNWLWPWVTIKRPTKKRRRRTTTVRPIIYHTTYRPTTTTTTFKPTIRHTTTTTTTKVPSTTSKLPPVTTTSKPPVTTTSRPATTTSLSGTTKETITTTNPPVTTSKVPGTTKPPLPTRKPPVTSTELLSTTIPSETTTEPTVTTTDVPTTTNEPPVTTTSPTSSTSGDVGIECPTNNTSGVDLFPRPTDCGKYYVCGWGVLILIPCPGGLHFNPKLNVCDLPENAGCDPGIHVTTIRTTAGVTTPSGTTVKSTITTSKPLETSTLGTTRNKPQPTNTPSMPTTSGPLECPAENSPVVTFLPNLEDCGKYYVCDSGKTIPMDCPTGLHFNPNINKCQYPEDAGGKLPPTQPPNAPLTSGGFTFTGVLSAILKEGPFKYEWEIKTI